MLPYRLDPAAAPHLDAARTIARDIAAPHAPAVDADGRFPDESLRALAAAGLWGLALPADHGGLGQGPRTFVAVVEALAEACGSTAMVYVMHVTAANAVAASRTLADRDRLLADMAAGRHLTTLAFSEKGSRSQFWAPISQLAPVDADGGGGYRVNAHKSWVTSAARADSFVASAQRPGAASPLESTTYLVRKGAAGVRTSGRFDGLGLRGNDSAPMIYEDLRVGEGDLLSAHGEGAKMKLEVVLPWFALGTSAMANGLSRAAVTATIAHLSSAGFAHTGTQLRDLPTLRARLGEMSVRTEQARALLGVALDHVEAGDEQAPLYVLQARLAALTAAADVTDLAMKAGGGAAFSRHMPTERLFRDARAGWVMAPTVDHLADFVGKALTGLPLFG